MARQDDKVGGVEIDIWSTNHGNISTGAKRFDEIPAPERSLRAAALSMGQGDVDQGGRELACTLG